MSGRGLQTGMEGSELSVGAGGGELQLCLKALHKIEEHPQLEFGGGGGVQQVLDG